MTERRGFLACRLRLCRWVTLSAAVLGVLVWGLPAPTAAAHAIPPPRPQSLAAGDLAPGPPHLHTAAASGDNGADYRMVAADGGIFDFGDATFHGSTGSVPLNRPMVGDIGWWPPTGGSLPSATPVFTDPQGARH